LGIETGLDQRLVVSHREDLCRVRRPEAMRRMRLFRHFSNSLFIERRRRRHKPPTKRPRSFRAMNAHHHRYAIRRLHARQPSSQTAS